MFMENRLERQCHWAWPSVPLGVLIQLNPQTVCLQYYSDRWLNGHLLGFCESGSETQTKTKECLSVGKSLPKETERLYVQQLSKGCYPGVIMQPGGTYCKLPGFPEPW